jgi:hypothetical protein
MILLRHKEQKEYSAALTKLIAGAKTVANKAMTKIDNAGLATNKALQNTIRGGGRPLNKLEKLAPKSATQIGRETIGMKNTASKVVNTPIGGVVDKGIQATIRRPDVAGTLVAAELTPGIVGGTTGVAMSAAPLEAAAGFVQKHPLLPKKALGSLDKLATKYSQTGMSKTLNNSQASLKTIGQGISKGASHMLMSTGFIPNSVAY